MCPLACLVHALYHHNNSLRRLRIRSSHHETLRQGLIESIIIHYFQGLITYYSIFYLLDYVISFSLFCLLFHTLAGLCTILQNIASVRAVPADCEAQLQTSSDDQDVKCDQGGVGCASFRGMYDVFK